MSSSPIPDVWCCEDTRWWSKGIYFWRNLDFDSKTIGASRLYVQESIVESGVKSQDMGHLVDGCCGYWLEKSVG
jgi:hypothetical protein